MPRACIDDKANDSTKRVRCRRRDCMDTHCMVQKMIAHELAHTYRKPT
jgi:hypothetical protein